MSEAQRFKIHQRTAATFSGEMPVCQLIINRIRRKVRARCPDETVCNTNPRRADQAATADKVSSR